MSKDHLCSAPGAELSIGRFSSLSRISIRMLRHYDQHALLVPCQIDPISGYRRYCATQLEDAIAIRQLRDVGMNVAQIGAVLTTRGTSEYGQALRRQREVLAEQATVVSRQVTLIDTLIQQQKEPTMSDLIVTIATLPATRIVALRGTIGGYAHEGELWGRFMPALEAQQIQISGPGGCIEHDEGFTEGEVDESVWFEVAPNTEVAPPLTVIDLPERRVATAQVTGEYGIVLPQAHDAIGRHLTEHGLQTSWQADEVASHSFNIYLTDPSVVPADQAVTTVGVPIQAD